MQGMLSCRVFLTWGEGPPRSKPVVRLFPQLWRCNWQCKVVNPHVLCMGNRVEMSLIISSPLCFSAL